MAGGGHGMLLIQRCTTCGHHHFPRRYACHLCGATTLEEVPAGLGTVVRTIEMLRSPGAQSAPIAPTRVALVRLDSGPLVLCAVTGADAVTDAEADAGPIRVQVVTGGTGPTAVPAH